MKTMYHGLLDHFMKEQPEQIKLIRDIVSMHPFLVVKPEDDILENIPNKSETNILDLPFQSVFVELEFDERKEGNMAIGVIEREVGKYSIFLFRPTPETHGESAIRVDWFNNDDPTDIENIKKFNLAFSAAKRVLEKVNRKNTYLAIEKTGRKKSIRKGKKKEYFDIKPITYVVNKKMYEQKSESLGHNIDWSHKFEVRGHWRKINTIGKNRDGEYCVQGFTWVKSHVRGEGELITKTRIVK